MTRASGFFLLGLLALFFASRMVFIDSDVPEWRVGHYDAFDELYYANLAFAHGAGHSEVKRLLSEDALSNGYQFCNWLQNGLVLGSIRVFGNTYGGFRGSSVAFGMFSLLLLAWLVSRHHPARRRWLAFALVYLTIDFGFLLATRIVEPTIGRVFALVATLALCSLWFERAERSALTSTALAASSMLLMLVCYPTNAFVPAGIALALVIDRALEKDGRAAALAAGTFVVGTAVALVAYWLLDRLLLGTSLITELHAALATGSARSVSSRSRQMGMLLLFNVVRITLANSFKTSPALLLTVLALMPAQLLRAWRRRTAWSRLLACVSIAFVAQTAVLNDYPERKLVIVVPLVLLLVFDGVDGFSEFVACLRGAPKLRRLYVSALVLAAATIVASWMRGKITQSIVLDWRGPRSLLPLELGAVGLVGAAAIASTFGWRRREAVRWSAAFAAVVPVAVASFMIVYSAPTFTYRDMMRDLSRYGSGRRFAGGLSLALQLYNDVHAFMSPYGYERRDEDYAATLTRLVAEGRVDYSAGYVDSARGDFSIAPAEALRFARVREYRLRAGDDHIVRVAVDQAPAR